MRRRSSALKATIKRTLFWLLFLSFTIYLGYQLFQYQKSRAFFPADMTIAAIDVSGLTPEEAGELLEERYLSPVAIYHEDERVELNPRDVGFNLEVDTMLAEAQQSVAERNYWLGYFYHLIGWTWRPIEIPLQAGYDPVLLREMLTVIADFLDQPAQSPQILSENAVFEQGKPGYVTDIDASMPLVEEALYRPEDRIAHLVVVDQESPELSFELLEGVIRSKLNSFDGMGSIFVMDLQTGEEININSDVALSGLSILKIAIFAEAYRHLELPLNDYEQQLFYDTAVRSSNYAANLLLHIVAGEDNTYAGADILTESMWRLGLENTFMAVPYDAVPPAHRRTTYTTPANSRVDLESQPDPTRQTTAEEMGALLAMIYHCAKTGGGTLMAVYPNAYTPEECQAILDLMVLNEEGNLIRFGVPNDVPVSHKHGWIPDTHGDAGVVFSPGGDYILVEYLHRPGGWLQADLSFPILREISRAVYNYFNFDDPYVGDALEEAERFEDVPGEPAPGEEEVPQEEADEGDGEGDTGAMEEAPAPTPTAPAAAEDPAETGGQ
ncbi:MAG: serine hydrolase [Candidatus Promineifilaceae bacterium]|nr:serine hydrolase [Candidatus Promineifilaceae bacterium]